MEGLLTFIAGCVTGAVVSNITVILEWVSGVYKDYKRKF